MHAHIIYFNFLNPNGEGLSIGGIQTYISNLIPVLKECGYLVSIYQRSNDDFYKNFGDYDVYGIGLRQNYGSKVSKALLSKALIHVNMSKDLLIYGCETCITKVIPCRTIAIQHGISWDVPFEECSTIQYIRHYLGKSLMAWNICQRVNKVDKLVCVDYNFVNWNRAITPYSKTRHIVIPNFTAIPQNIPTKNNGIINIFFARRLFVHRGTRLFTNVAAKILSEQKNINITIAGTGPDADYMHSILDSYKNVTFITYDSHESLHLHKDKDIAVIPTIGSEGTSLSLLEAMASGCAVICSNVGGMTNIVLDGYNGLIINPDEESLYNAIITLLYDHSLRSKLQFNAYNTVKEAFSLDIWRKKWAKVIKQTNNIL